MMKGLDMMESNLHWHNASESPLTANHFYIANFQEKIVVGETF